VQLLLGLNLFSTLAMVGLIWFVQIVHYPLLSIVGEDQFRAYMKQHRRLTSRVVGPLMLVEAFTSAGLLYQPPAAGQVCWLWCGLGLVLVIWLSTACLQMPRHTALTDHGFSASHHTALVRTNRVRTLAWTARGLLMTGLACGPVSI